ncbi:MAG: putative O-methyltransferase YrrM [Candidatus Paceibacteria bacterium]|jgi:predicted O-methyltransferase YrrM
MEQTKAYFRQFYLYIANWYHGKFKAPKRYHHLFDEVVKNKAATILEVGTWNGVRALQMIETAQKNTSETINYIGFDLFEDLTNEIFLRELSKKPPSQNDVEQKLLKTGANITLIKGNTLETLPEYIKNAPKVDFIFIDGGHDVATIQSDWDCVNKLMHDETVVIFDDYWRNRKTESAGPTVDTIDTDIYNVEILPEIDKFDNSDFGRLEISFARVKKLIT